MSGALPARYVSGGVTSVAHVPGHDRVVVGTSEGRKYTVHVNGGGGAGAGGSFELLEESHCAAISETVFAPPGSFGVDGGVDPDTSL